MSMQNIDMLASSRWHAYASISMAPRNCKASHAPRRASRMPGSLLSFGVVAGRKAHELFRPAVSRPVLRTGSVARQGQSADEAAGPFPRGQWHCAGSAAGRAAARVQGGGPNRPRSCSARARARVKRGASLRSRCEVSGQSKPDSAGTSWKWRHKAAVRAAKASQYCALGNIHSSKRRCSPVVGNCTKTTRPLRV
jgi:hypothetical protein